MQGPLFAGKDIDSVRKGRRERIDSDLAEIDNPTELDDPSTEEQLLAGARMTLPELRRPEADIDFDEHGDKVDVRVTVPVMGEPLLLEVKPETFSSRVPRGLVDRRSLYGRGANGRLVFTNSFPRQTSAEKIKEWAGQQADLVEEWIEFLRPSVDMHNADVEKLVKQGIERRRKELSDLHDLRDSLGRGI